MLTHTELIARIASGAALGGIIGYERHLHRRPVGLRTHCIVSMTAATFMVISSQFVYWQRYTSGDLVTVDPSRIAASVVSGIGFLAGGAILRTGLTVQGLTTAAGLWLVTAVGMACGAGMYVEASAVTIMGLLALTLLRRFEVKNDHVVRRHISVVLREDTEIAAIIGALAELGVTVSNMEYDRRLDDEKKRIVAAFDVQHADTVEVMPIVRAIEGVPGVRRVHVQGAA